MYRAGAATRLSRVFVRRQAKQEREATPGEDIRGQRLMAAAVCNALRRGCGLAHQQPLTRWGGLAAAAVGGSRAYHGDQNNREPRTTRPRRDGRDVNRERAAARTNIAMAGTLASGHQGLVFKTVDDYNQFMQSQLNQSMETGFGHRSYIAYVDPQTPPTCPLARSGGMQPRLLGFRVWVVGLPFEARDGAAGCSNGKYSCSTAWRWMASCL